MTKYLFYDQVHFPDDSNTDLRLSSLVLDFLKWNNFSFRKVMNLS